MADPLLTTLCTICHLSPPKYTCPRCAQRTCSLACARRHKAWASCSGVRDPTAYVPASRLRTPAGIDHDYNFLTAIERGRERRQREVVEERGIFGEGELRRLLVVGSKGGEDAGRGDRGRRPPPPWARGGRRGAGDDGGEGGVGGTLDRKVRRRLDAMGIEVVEMPRGMARQKENTTSWNRRTNRVNWAVEWMAYGGDGACTRVRHKALETVPLYRAAGHSLDWHRKGEEKQRDAAAAADEDDEDDGPARKRRRRGPLIQEVDDGEDAARASPWGAMQSPGSAAWLPAAYPAQNPFTGAWAREGAPVMASWAADQEAAALRLSRFFLLNPLTPAGKPRELIPVGAGETLAEALAGRTVVEFPTIYVLPPLPAAAPPALPAGHVLGSTERRPPPAAQKRKAPQDQHRQQLPHRGGHPQKKRAVGAGPGAGDARDRRRVAFAVDAEEGEVDSGGEGAPAGGPAAAAAAQQDEDATSSEGETTMSSGESSGAGDSDDDGEEEERRPAAQAATPQGLVDYGSDEDDEDDEGEGRGAAEGLDVGELNVENPELLQGAVREIVNLLT